MLAGVPFFRAQFLAREAQGVDERYVARAGGDLAGFVSFAGRFLRARFTGYVGPGYRGRGLGARLLEVADAYYAGNGWTERAAARLLTRHGFAFSCAQHVMERRGGPLPEGAFEVRLYEDADYPAYARIMADAFWNLREEPNLTPNFDQPPSEEERRGFANRTGTCLC